MIELCPWCGAKGYDNVIKIEGDPIDVPRCGSCWNDVRYETIQRMTKPAESSTPTHNVDKRA